MTADAITVAGLPVRHGFFTRRGGVSTGPFESLNCSLSSSDDRACVLENRAIAARALGAAPDRLVGLHQVHGAEVVTVAGAWVPGEGPRADGMVTDQPGLALGIVTADCAPVLFADPAGRVIGAAHAGWRGAVAGVLEATAAAMRALGADRITAAIGPCIGQASYEVRADLRDAVLAATPSATALFADGARPGHWQFDLTGYCRLRLLESGVACPIRAEADTAAEPERFFSHRRRTLAGGGPIGHQMSVVVL